MSYIKIDMNGIVVKRCANLKSRFLGGVTEASVRKEIEKTAKEVYFGSSIIYFIILLYEQVFIFFPEKKIYFGTVISITS